MFDLSRRDFTTAALAAITGAAGPAAAAGPAEPKPLTPKQCKYHDGGADCHPAVARAVLALVLFDQACNLAWGEYSGVRELNCRCPDCQGAYDTLMMAEPLAKLFSDMLHGGVRGGVEGIVASAPSIVREYLGDLAMDFEKDLLKLKAAGELPDAEAWAGPLAEVASLNGGAA